MSKQTKEKQLNFEKKKKKKNDKNTPFNMRKLVY